MKKLTINLLWLIFLLYSNSAFTQEWKSFKNYEKETANSILCVGCWLTKDRKNNTKVWKQANQYNLQEKKGSEKYISLSQKRDFYNWFDSERKRLNHEIKWIGIATVAAEQLSKVDNNFIRIFIVRNKEVVQFINTGSDKVFEFAFSHLKEVYISSEILKGKTAKNWDSQYGLDEQCLILEPLYNNLSTKAIKRLEKMAKGRGIFSFGVPETLKYEGDIKDCLWRYKHGVNKLFPYYLDK